MERITYDCINYNISLYDLVIPTTDVLYKLCLSKDKTKLVMISIIRFITLLIIFYVLNSKDFITFDMNKIIKTFIFSMFVAYLIINLVYIPIAMMKEVTVDKYFLEKTVDGLANVLYENKVSKPANLPPTF